MALYDPYDTGYTDYFTRMMRAKAAQSLGFYKATRSFGERLQAGTVITQEEKKPESKGFLYLAIGAIAALIFFGKKKG